MRARRDGPRAGPSRRWLIALVPWVALVVVGASRRPTARHDEPAAVRRPIIVASKPFGESFILAELFAQLLEAHGRRVERRPGLGATELDYSALRAGSIDCYPEYTGTGLLAILHAPMGTDARAVFDAVLTGSMSRDSIRWLPPLGFQNRYAVAVRRATADSLHLVTLDDLARAGHALRAGFTADFIGRPDGLPALARAYGLHLGRVDALGQALKYQALASGAVDVIDGYSTDGLLARYDLVVLTDNRQIFPPYEAAAVVGAALQRDDPDAIVVLTELSGVLDEARMRELNRRLEVDGTPVATLAHDALQSLGLARRIAPSPSGRSPDGVAPTGDAPSTDRQAGLWGYLVAERGHLLALTARHLTLVLVSLGVAIVTMLPAALLLARAPRRAGVALGAVGALQTVPGIALLAFMIPLFGIGVGPALVALILYSLYPILRNAYVGIREADPGAVDAAVAVGMSPSQVLLEVRLPLAAPVIMAGIRTAAVLAVGTATLAAFIGAGGLGEPIVTGLALADTRMILSGAIPAAGLALVVDGLLALVERRLVAST